MKAGVENMCETSPKTSQKHHEYITKKKTFNTNVAQEQEGEESESARIHLRGFTLSHFVRFPGARRKQRRQQAEEERDAEQASLAGADPWLEPQRSVGALEKEEWAKHVALQQEAEAQVRTQRMLAEQAELDRELE